MSYQCEVCEDIVDKEEINFLPYHEMCAECVCDKCLEEAYKGNNE